MSDSPKITGPSKMEAFLFFLPTAAFFIILVLEFLPDGICPPKIKELALTFFVIAFAVSVLAGFATVLRIVWRAVSLFRDPQNMKEHAGTFAGAFSDAGNNAENCADDDVEDDADDDAEYDPMETLFLKKDPPLYASQPFDGNWGRDETAEEFTIFQNGKFSIASTLFLGFFTTFWNAVTWTAVVELILQGDPLSKSWPEFLFFIPFILVGIGTFAAAFLSLFAGKVKKSWTITRDELRYSEKLFGFTFKKENSNVSQTDRLEIEPDSLWFLSDDEEILASISDLTQKEARWLASRFQMMHYSR